MQTPDLFTPAEVAHAILTWTETTYPKNGRRYRWALVPGTPLGGRDGSPEGFVLEFWTGSAPMTSSPGWMPVNFAPRRDEIWAWLVKTGEVHG